MWVTLDELGGAGPANTIEQSLESGLVAKLSIQANQTTNWSRTCWVEYGPRPLHPPDVINVMKAFCFLLLFHIIVKANWRAKRQQGPGMRLNKLSNRNYNNTVIYFLLLGLNSSLQEGGWGQYRDILLIRSFIFNFKWINLVHQLLELCICGKTESSEKYVYSVESFAR